MRANSKKQSKADIKGWIIMAAILFGAIALGIYGSGCDPTATTTDATTDGDGGTTTDDGGAKQDTAPVPDGGQTDSGCYHNSVDLYDGGGVCLYNTCDCHECDTYYNGLYNTSWACTLHNPSDPSKDFQFTTTLNPSSTTYYSPFWAHLDGCYIDFGKACQCPATPDMMTAQVIECKCGHNTAGQLTCTKQ